jgi:pimeloyl-ACP methyl ester carboxylesterase
MSSPPESSAPMPPTQYADARGLRLAYAEWPGRPGAPPIICLPHLTGHKGSFADLAAFLAPDFHVYAVDLRGRGDSEKPLEGYGFAYHARDLLAFADALGLDAFSLVGHSFGATAAVYLGSVRPDRLRAVVLMDGGADPKEATLKAMYPTIRRLGQVYATLDAYLAAMRAIPFFRPWSAAFERYFRDDVYVGPNGAVAAKSSAQAIERDLDQHFAYSLCLHFPALRCPVLFLRPLIGLLGGDRGHVFTEREARAVVANIPDCRWVNVPGVNHYTVLQHAASPAFAPLRDFLEAVLGVAGD